jgi:hypothetical protein
MNTDVVSPDDGQGVVGITRLIDRERGIGRVGAEGVRARLAGSLVEEGVRPDVAGKPLWAVSEVQGRLANIDEADSVRRLINLYLFG